MDEAAINKWFWVVIAGAAVLLLAIGGGFYFVYMKHSDTAIQLEATNKEAAELAKTLALLNARQKEIKENEALSKTYEAFLPSTEDIPGMFEEISAKAVAKNLLVNYASATVPTKSSAKTKGKTKELYETRVFNFNLVGKYTDIVAFVNEVERLERFVMVNKLTITGAQSSKSFNDMVWSDPTSSPWLNCSVLIYTFVYTGGQQ